MKNQKIRSMKVHEQSGYNYKATPTIILKGQQSVAMVPSGSVREGSS